MDRRSASTGPGRAGRSVGRSFRSRAAGRADWSCSIRRTSWRSRGAWSRSRRPSDARSDPNRTRAVSRAGIRAAGCCSNRGGTLDGGGTVRSGAWGARGIASRSPTCARATRSIAPEGGGAAAPEPRRSRGRHRRDRGRGSARSGTPASKGSRSGRPRPRCSPMPCWRPGTTRSGRQVRASSAGWTTSRSSPPIAGRGRRRSAPSGRRGHRSVWRCTSGRRSSWTIRGIWPRRLGTASNMHPATSTLR